MATPNFLNDKPVKYDTAPTPPPYAGTATPANMRSYIVTPREQATILAKNPSAGLFLVNQSYSTIKVNMRVTLSVRDEHGTEVLIEVPDTWAPYEVVSIDAQAVMRSSGFLRAVEQGHIAIINPYVAADLLQDPEVKAELDRIRPLATSYGDLYNQGKAVAPVIKKQTASAIRDSLFAAVNTGTADAIASIIKAAQYTNAPLTTEEKAFIREKVTDSRVLNMLT